MMKLGLLKKLNLHSQISSQSKVHGGGVEEVGELISRLLQIEETLVGEEEGGEEELI